ncbi:MAG: anti-sigma-F factor Fin [Symbiobacteriia bacterium]
MRLRYICDRCGETVTLLDMEPYDEKRLGFDILTPEERADIIKPDGAGGLTVSSICDDCADTGSAEAGQFIH